MDELISRVFAARNAAHLEHWLESSGYRHEALAGFYAGVIDALDSLVEKRIALLRELPGDIDAAPAKYSNFLDYLQEEADWIETNRDELSGESQAIGALVDDLVAVYLELIFKLSRLK